MLKIKNIDVYYEDLQALWGVSFEVNEKEILALLGPNGAGKSTTIRTISGLLRPARGSITLDGVRLDRTPAHRIVELGICQVPEGRGIFPGMSVLENLEMGAFNSIARKFRGQSLELVYQVFPILKTRTKQQAGTLSGGEQQMVAIGRSLMSKPKLLLLDEPSLGLAPVIVSHIFEVIKEINRLGVTILLVEQNVRLSLSIANRAYILENGRVVGSGEAKTLMEDSHVKNAYLGVA